ncbi:MAG TPA: cbb3-type cytochrome c oxidase subunit I [Acidimicrobiales bacterium]|nr:cbb3-type cytochrome c oxidase subunit I [Acidimicrobiales bacterium]
MTVTEAPPSAPTETRPAAVRELRGLPAVLGSGDHKTVGRLWLGGAALFLLGTVVVGAILGFEAVTLDKLEVLGRDNVLQAFSAYRWGLAFLVVIPFFLGLATAIVPLQVGAPSIAFPRAAAGALWTWFGGAIVLVLSYALDGGPVGGPDIDADAVAMGLVGLALVLIGIVLGTVCVVTTAIALRAPVMRLFHVPPFTWSMVVAGSIWILSIPVLLAGVLLAYLDLRYGQVEFATPDTLFQRLQWAFDQPQVYVLAIPVLGIAAEVVPVSVGVVQKGRAAVLAGIAAFGALAFGAWAQPAFDPSILEDAPYVLVAFVIGLPLLAVVGGLADSARTGTPKLRPPLLLVVLGILVLLAAVGAGAAHVVDGLDLLGTSWQPAHLDLVFTACLLGVAAGVAWWAPKLWGRFVPTPVALLAGLVIAGGGLLTAVPKGIAGALDQPAFPFAGGFEIEDSMETLNLVSAIGAIVLALGAVLLVLGLLRAALGRGRHDDVDDPWAGQTLEWSTTSPPPVGNFAAPVPEVTTATPLVATDEEGA